VLRACYNRSFVSSQRLPTPGLRSSTRSLAIALASKAMPHFPGRPPGRHMTCSPGAGIRSTVQAAQSIEAVPAAHRAAASRRTHGGSGRRDPVGPGGAQPASWPLAREEV
jgi:hypothetical protein